MKIAVQSLLLLFLSTRRVHGEEEQNHDDSVYAEGDGGYGVLLAGKDDCLVAENIASVPFTSSGDTQETLGQGFAEAQTCDLVRDFTQGVWFTLVGNGACYNATTLGSRFDTILSVYTGEADCQDLFCLTQNDDGSNSGYGYGIGLTSKVVFRTEVEQSYYILLAGIGSSSGSYRFSLEVRRTFLCCSRPLLLSL
jgi:hypothetical protein